jgi:hypothetical protein
MTNWHTCLNCLNDHLRRLGYRVLTINQRQSYRRSKRLFVWRWFQRTHGSWLKEFTRWVSIKSSHKLSKKYLRVIKQFANFWTICLLRLSVSGSGSNSICRVCAMLLAHRWASTWENQSLSVYLKGEDFTETGAFSLTGNRRLSWKHLKT